MMSYNNTGAGYNPMGAPAPMAPTGGRAVARGVSIGCSIICLMLLLILAIPAVWLGIPAWHVRVSGVQAQGTARLTQSCGTTTDENGNRGAETFHVTIQFTDQQGRQHQVGSHWGCNNFYDNGEQISLWYLPNDPSSFLTSGEATWLYIFTALWSVIVLVLLIVLAIALSYLLRRPKPVAPRPMAWG